MKSGYIKIGLAVPMAVVLIVIAAVYQYSGSSASEKPSDLPLYLAAIPPVLLASWGVYELVY
jgi:hypothetical protein